MKDNFSKQATEYARFRPTYPTTLFNFLNTLCRQYQQAWDCATGNGQVARELANTFSEVFATDISEKQLSGAPQLPNINYSCQPAEKTNFRSESFDLITVAQAVHWFQFDEFFTEAYRVLKPGGILALVGYGLLQASEREVNALLLDFYQNKIDRYWDPERKYVDDHYRSIPFPYREIKAPPFSIEVEWTLPQLTGYLFTWSAVQHYLKRHGDNPVKELEQKLKEAWPKEETLKISFPLFTLIGRKPI